MSDLKNEKYALISVVGLTDPIRSEYDGPILHIIRHYHPENVILIFTKETGEQEMTFGTMEKAIHLLDPDCKIDFRYTEVADAHSFDSFTDILLDICTEARESFLDRQLLLNITSGTPQMETALCMVALSDPDRYVAIQVATPVKAANKNVHFDPKVDNLDDWFEIDLDNEPGSSSRCIEPKLLNFKRPMVQFQIQSLISNYDYSGALQLFERNHTLFCDNVGVLLNHAKYRLNLEYSNARKCARELKLEDRLYPVKGAKEIPLVEYYNSMNVKQKRQELHDFSLRMEVFTEEMASYILTELLKISISDLTHTNKTTGIVKWDEYKSESRYPGITDYLNKESSNYEYKWGSFKNGRTTIMFLKYFAEKKGDSCILHLLEELEKWQNLSSEVRNKAAHNMIAVTEEMIAKAYDGKKSDALCKNIRWVMMSAMGRKISNESLHIFDMINDLIEEELAKPANV